MIRSLLQVGMTVPDLEVGKSFYELFGLNARVSGDDVLLRCDGLALDQLRLMLGPKKKLSYVSFGTDAQGFQNIQRNLEKENVAIHSTAFGVEAGLWFQDPHGDWVNVRVGDVPPSSQAPANAVNAPGHYHRIGKRACNVESLQRKARPHRLGHLIKFSPDVDRSVDFYTRVLGMKVSDKALDVLAFLRCGNGGDHHTLAFAKSSHTGLHHLSFEVSDIDEIEIGAQTLLQAGYKDGFGLGRHVGGSNYFHYVRDPWNSLAEYFWDIDVIPEDDSAWVPLNVPPQDITAVWAVSPPPADFVLNFEEQS